MNYNNGKRHHRRSIRLQGYDYSQEGLYFITICCQDKRCRFGEIENGEMRLNEYGQIAQLEWLKLQERFPNFELDSFQIMPNHIHGIISLMGVIFMTDSTEDHSYASDMASEKAETMVIPTIPTIVGAYKSLVSNGCLEIYNAKKEIKGRLWQRNYWEHIIRNEHAHQKISEYIINNPANWIEDEFYTG